MTYSEDQDHVLCDILRLGVLHSSVKPARTRAQLVIITIVYVYMASTTQLMAPATVRLSVVRTVLPCEVVQDKTSPPVTCELTGPDQR